MPFFNLCCHRFRFRSSAQLYQPFFHHVTLTGRESKRKIVLTQMEGETAITDASALHDTPPNINQYQKHQLHTKPKAPKDPRFDNNNKTPQRFDQQQQLQQQQSRALIHADERKTTTAHAGHTPRSDRRRKDRKSRTGRIFVEFNESVGKAIYVVSRKV